MGLINFVSSLFGSSSPVKASTLPEQVERFKNVINRLVSAINEKDYKSIQQDFSKQMLKALPIVKLQPFIEKLLSDYGTIKNFDPSRITTPDKAITPAHFERAILDIKIILDGNSKIVMLQFLPHQVDLPVPERNSNSFVLPFEGKWFVAAGGKSLDINPHNEIQFQRYAYDFLIKDDSGKTHSGDGKKCEDYYAFGKSVLCPADGVVSDVITGVRDNVPPAMNEYSAVGNCVIIQHAEYELSVIAHFKYGSILVKPGEKVKKAQVLGACGNSGHSSEPHIHYHLQNTPIIQDGTGILSHFEKVDLYNNSKMEVKFNYSPIQGDIISQSK
jgi:hypothetical protein